MLALCVVVRKLDLAGVTETEKERRRVQVEDKTT